MKIKLPKIIAGFTKVIQQLDEFKEQTANELKATYSEIEKLEHQRENQINELASAEVMQSNLKKLIGDK